MLIDTPRLNSSPVEIRTLHHPQTGEQEKGISLANLHVVFVMFSNEEVKLNPNMGLPYSTST